MAITAAASVGSAAMSTNAANSASKRAGKSEAAQLAFAQEKYDDWKEIFGPIQENLADFYNNMDSDFIAAQGLEYYEQERDKALTQVRESLAQRGIANSGIAGAIETNSIMQGATDKARIRAEAPMKAAELKSSFLQIGLGQDPSNSMQDVLNQNANRANQRSMAAGEAAGEAVGSAIDSVVDYYGFTQRNNGANYTDTPNATNVANIA